MNEKNKDQINYAELSDEEYIRRAARILAHWANKTLTPIIMQGAVASLLFKNDATDFYEQTRDFFAKANLNRKRALAIGFKPWSEDAPQLLLAPLWYCGMIPEGEEVVTIGGTREKYSKTMDHDIRFGVVAFGFEFDEAGAEEVDSKENKEVKIYKKYRLLDAKTGEEKHGKYFVLKIDAKDEKERECVENAMKIYAVTHANRGNSEYANTVLDYLHGKTREG